MKRLVLIITIMATTLLANPYSVPSVAVEQAVKQNKLILAMVLSDNCIYCKQQIAEIEQSPDFKNYLNKNFIVLTIDADREPIPSFITFLGSTPTIVVVDNFGHTISQMNGMVETEELYSHLVELVEARKNYQKTKNNI